MVTKVASLTRRHSLQVILAARVEHRRLRKKKVATDARVRYQAAAKELQDSGNKEMSGFEELRVLADTLRGQIDCAKNELQAVEPSLRAVLSMTTVAELYRRAALKDWTDAVAV